MKSSGVDGRLVVDWGRLVGSIGVDWGQIVIGSIGVRSSFVNSNCTRNAMKEGRLGRLGSIGRLVGDWGQIVIC